MPALDIFHQIVRTALEKEGWTVTHDPLKLELEEDRLYADLGAEKLISAEKGIRKIAVEVKTFGSPSPMRDLESAIGQYIAYRILLRRLEPERELYLAVPQDTLFTLFQRPVGAGFIEFEQGKVIGYDPESEEIVQWLPQ
jgi:hypothetical protein